MGAAAKGSALERARRRSQCVVQSWLSSWRVPFRKKGRNLMVQGKTVSFEPEPTDSADVVLLIGPLLGRNPEASMAEVAKLMAAIGRDVPELPRRGSAARARCDDYLARSMRLTQFTRAANPSDEALAPHLTTVKREADRACRRYVDLTRRVGLEPRDYFSVGMVFLTIYLHRFQDLDNEERNGANLTLFLQQEFSRWSKVTRKDMRSIVPDARGMLVSQIMAAPLPGARVEWRSDSGEPSYVVPEYVEAEGGSRVAMTAAEASEAVSRALAAMSHDEMVEKLAGVIRNDYLDCDTRDAAAARFKRHLASCTACRAADEAWVSRYGRTRA